MVAAAAAACLLMAPAAQATFHLIQVREVYPGSAAAPETDYVELQMYSGGQEFVAGHFVRTYDASGAVTGTSTFPADVASGDNQRTLLLATAQAAEQFGVAADTALAPGSKLSPLGGAVCWEALDCVSWGNFAGTLPSPAGSPAAPAGIPDGMALRRSIARSCATALDPADDSDDSAADFEAAAPLPRPNSVAPTEVKCASGTPGPGSGPTGGSAPPQTTLKGKPAKRTRDRTPTFRFGSDDRSAKFECKLDRRAYRSCRSPFTTKRLAPGPHRFRVRARNGAGVDPTPVSFRFRVLPRG
ncbi:MAG TPA: hypothetical protein VK480_02365 [Solirubrobacterales bacterium]|nr:hypothetical protein [Solirubrobacterales bacterium]